MGHNRGPEGSKVVLIGPKGSWDNKRFIHLDAVYSDLTLNVWTTDMSIG